MKVKNVYYSSHFKRALKRYSKKQKNFIKKHIELFLKDPFHPSLKTHKLKGKLKGYWSFSINYELRVLFEFIDEDTVGFVDIGTHSIYR